MLSYRVSCLCGYCIIQDRGICPELYPGDDSLTRLDEPIRLNVPVYSCRIIFFYNRVYFPSQWRACVAWRDRKAILGPTFGRVGRNELPSAIDRSIDSVVTCSVPLDSYYIYIYINTKAPSSRRRVADGLTAKPSET